jgi:hypothetical protein
VGVPQSGRATREQPAEINISDDIDRLATIAGDTKWQL